MNNTAREPPVFSLFLLAVAVIASMYYVVCTYYVELELESLVSCLFESLLV